MLTKRYHKDKGFPQGLDMPKPGMELQFSRHAVDKAISRTDLSLMPRRVPSDFEVIEVSTFADVAAWWVIRFPLMKLTYDKDKRTIARERTDKDVVMALGTTLVEPLTVRTVYLNHKDDKHSTLRLERYDTPEGR